MTGLSDENHALVERVSKAPVDRTMDLSMDARTLNAIIDAAYAAGGAYYKQQADRWRGIAAAMGYEPKAHLSVRPTEDWLLERIAYYRTQVTGEEAHGILDRLDALERDSHPPIDLGPAIEEYLASRAGDELPADVVQLVIAAREVAYDERLSPEALRTLDQAAEAFASRVPWDNEPGADGPAATPGRTTPPPAPPWPPGDGNNAKRTGWMAFFAGDLRESCPFPANRRDLKAGYEHGFDAAAESLRP